MFITWRHVVSQIKYTQLQECWQGKWLVFVGTDHTGTESEVRKAHHYHPVSQPWFKPRPAWFPGQILFPQLLEYTSVSRRAWMRNKHTVDPNWILLSCFTHTLVTTKHLASNHSLENVSLYFWYHSKERGLIHCRQLTVIFSWMTVPTLISWAMSKCDSGNMVPASNVKINNHQRNRTFSWEVVFGFISWWIVVSASLGTFQKEVEEKGLHQDIKTEPWAVWHKVQVTQQLCMCLFFFFPILNI